MPKLSQFPLILDNSSSLADKSTQVYVPICRGRRRKSFALKIDSHQGIFLDVPKAISDSQLSVLLTTHEAWIRQNYLKLQARLESEFAAAQLGTCDSVNGENFSDKSFGDQSSAWNQLNAPQDEKAAEESKARTTERPTKTPITRKTTENNLKTGSSFKQDFFATLKHTSLPSLFSSADLPQSRLGFVQSRQQTEPLFLGKVDFLGSQKSVWLDNGAQVPQSEPEKTLWVRHNNQWHFSASDEHNACQSDRENHVPCGNRERCEGQENQAFKLEKPIFQQLMQAKDWQALQRFVQGLRLPKPQKQQLIQWAKENLKPITWQWLIVQTDFKNDFSLHLQANRLISEHFIDGLPKKVQFAVWQWLLQWLLGKCYQQLLESYLPKVLPSYAQQMQVSYKKVEVRSYKSRWGSCKSDRSLQFNWRALQAPLWVLDYLIVHELAHLKHPDHSPQFWQFVADHYSPTPQAKQVFKQQGSRWIQFLNLAYR